LETWIKNLWIPNRLVDIMSNWVVETFLPSPVDLSKPSRNSTCRSLIDNLEQSKSYHFHFSCWQTVKSHIASHYLASSTHNKTKQNKTKPHLTHQYQAQQTDHPSWPHNHKRQSHHSSHPQRPLPSNPLSTPLTSSPSKQNTAYIATRVAWNLLLARRRNRGGGGGSFWCNWVELFLKLEGAGLGVVGMNIDRKMGFRGWK